jgi:predicted TIM-barrel fold metal-dependent hydrolase
MEIVDAQLHIWAPESPERPWPAGRAREAQKPYHVGAEALLLQMDLAGVAAAVLVPPSWEGDRNDVALDAARRYPGRFAVMGRIAVEDPASRALIAGWKGQPGMLGVRVTFFNEHNRHFLTDGTADWLWAAAERAGIPVMVFAPGLLDHVAAVAQRHPVLKLVIDHAGLRIWRRPPEVWDELPAVCALARHANVAVKVSGMPSLSAEPYPFPDLWPHIRALVDSFGPRRAFWGTDLTRMPCTYYECITLFTRHLDWLKGDDLEWVMGRALREWLGWQPGPPA